MFIGNEESGPGVANFATVSQAPTTQTTDIFAILTFATGMLGIWFLPLVFTPICYLSAIISYYRIKEIPNLKGKGLRIIGAILGAISMLYLFCIFGNTGRLHDGTMNRAILSSEGLFVLNDSNEMSPNEMPPKNVIDKALNPNGLSLPGYVVTNRYLRKVNDEILYLCEMRVSDRYDATLVFVKRGNRWYYDKWVENNWIGL